MRHRTRTHGRSQYHLLCRYYGHRGCPTDIAFEPDESNGTYTCAGYVRLFLLQQNATHLVWEIEFVQAFRAFKIIVENGRRNISLVRIIRSSVPIQMK